MRRAAFAALSLLWLSGAAEANVRVEAIRKSSQRIRVMALRDGIPVKDVKIDVFVDREESPQSSIETDEHGIAVLPLLRPGSYHVSATASGGFHADLYLEVAKNNRKTTSFSMQLSSEPSPPPSLEQRIAAAEERAKSERLQGFTGVVEDQMGATIGGTKIKIFRRGASGKGPAVEAESDAVGRFSVRLADGTYTAVFMSQGFRPQITAFDLDQKADKRDLRIVLQVAPVAE
jgi:Carboxypeptidase regulatory-like domain